MDVAVSLNAPPESPTGGPCAMNLPWIESPFFESILAAKRLTPEQEELARQFHRDGYLVLDHVVPDDLVAQIISETRPLYTSDPDGPRSAYRVQHAWRESPAVRELASNTRILELLELLYGRPAFPFQTLNFQYGSQQAGHSDQIHFSSLPPRYMCGVWAALEDVDDDNGPLFYYPGSHRLPEYDLYDIGLSVEHADYRAYERFVAALMSELGLERKRLHAKRGSVLIWSSNIVHGGMTIATPGRTRHSQVTHYYFNNCIYYTPVYSNRTMGEYMLSADAIDIRTGQVVTPSYNGRPFEPIPLGNGRTRIDFSSGHRIAVERTLEQAVQQELEHLIGSRTYRVVRAFGAGVRAWRTARARLLGRVSTD